ncbi:MAG: PTS sugar transporter subunit IIA [Bacillota bacterium]|nr:PTS sugar transporter subunit IIA [Bacillota bacterium]
MIIDKDLILLDLTGDKETIISTLANQAFEQGRLEDKQEYIEAVLKREKEYSTALGYEVAIPHGQSDTVKDPFVVFGRVKEPIIWDQNSVRLIFMIGVPQHNKDKIHMKILANISRKLIDDEFRKSLIEAKDEKEIFDILSQITI